MNCPHCGQRMLTRKGIQLSPREADLFDLIAQRTQPMDVLCWVWAGAEKTVKTQRDLVKATVYHINSKLVETDFKIVGRGKHPVFYELTQT